MDTNFAIRGSLANLPDDIFEESAFVAELQAHGFSAADSRIILERAILEGYVQRAGELLLRRLSRVSYGQACSVRGA